jgi:hypothetical protein
MSRVVWLVLSEFSWTCSVISRGWWSRSYIEAGGLLAPDAQARCHWLNKSPMHRCHGIVPHLATGKAIGSSKSPMQVCHNMHCEPPGYRQGHWLEQKSNAILRTIPWNTIGRTKEQRHTIPWNTIGRTKVQCINTQVLHILKITLIPLKDNISVNLHPKRSVYAELVTNTRKLFRSFIDNHNTSNL